MPVAGAPPGLAAALRSNRPEGGSRAAETARFCYAASGLALLYTVSGQLHWRLQSSLYGL